MIGRNALGLLALFILIPAVMHQGNSTTTKSPEPEPACASDWTKCANVEDMANNFHGWSRAKVDCEWDANKMAKYGTPEWPWIDFGSFYPGPVTGKATLIEPDAKFQNGFGAMAHTRVVCEYDFRANKVINITLTAR